MKAERVILAMLVFVFGGCGQNKKIAGEIGPTFANMAAAANAIATVIHVPIPIVLAHATQAVILTVVD